MASSQSIRCPKHGFYYHPTRDEGCVECVKELANEPPAASAPSSGRFSPVTGIIWLLVLGGLGWGGYRFFLAMGDRGEVPCAEWVKVGPRLKLSEELGGPLSYFQFGTLDAELVVVGESESRIDPTLVRGPLEQLENLIFAKAIDPISQATRIPQATVVLYTALTTSTSQLLTAHQRCAIIAFHNLAGPSEGLEYSTISIHYIQRAWELVRAQVFHEAAWFKQPVWR